VAGNWHCNYCRLGRVACGEAYTIRIASRAPTLGLCWMFYVLWQGQPKSKANSGDRASGRVADQRSFGNGKNDDRFRRSVRDRTGRLVRERRGFGNIRPWPASVRWSLPTNGAVRLPRCTAPVNSRLCYTAYRVTPQRVFIFQRIRVNRSI
jgi:hypothetical protein